MKSIFVLLCAAALVTAELVSLDSINGEQVNFDDGEWVMVTGIVDSVLSRSKFQIVDTTGSIIISLRKHTVKVEDTLRVFGIIDRTLRKQVFQIEAKTLYRNGIPEYEYPVRHSLPEIYRNTAENRLLYDALKRNKIRGWVRIGSGTLFLTGFVIYSALILGGDDEEPVRAVDSSSAYLSYPSITLDIDTKGVEYMPAVAMAVTSTFFYITGVHSFVEAKRIPELKLQSEDRGDLSLQFYLIPSLERPGIMVNGSF